LKRVGISVSDWRCVLSALIKAGF